MAPIDRNEHRQQRMRGAGTTSASTNFSFSFGGLSRGATAKQTSLPPRPPSRQTPTRNGTPRVARDSAKSRRSISVQRSGTSNRDAIPSQELVTPRLGKRKRGSAVAQTPKQDGEVDELSPDHDQHVPSVERGRRVAATVSPIREELDDLVDELSVIGDMPSSVIKGTPVIREFNDAGAPPETPMLSLAANSMLSSSSGTRIQATPAQQEVDEQDELTPQQASITNMTPAPRPPLPSQIIPGEVDELSPDREMVAEQQQAANAKSKRGRKPRHIIDSLDDDGDQQPVQATPVIRKSRPTQGAINTSAAQELHEEDSEIEQGEGLDELTPDQAKQKSRQERAQAEFSDQELEESVDSEPEKDSVVPTRTVPRPPARRSSPKKRGRPKDTSDKPLRKKQKRGPSQLMYVMRLKGHKLKGVSVVDTTRQVIEEWLEDRVKGLTDRLANARDKSHARKIRQQRNFVMRYTEKLDDLLFDLQDANNAILADHGTLKESKKDVKRLTREYLTIQRDLDALNLENDEIRDEFMRERRQVEEQHDLSAALYDIENAIHSGRERARQQGREEEGPEIPLKMLLDDVARNVDPSGGLLTHIRHFNGVLDRAAGLLEGRL